MARSTAASTSPTTRASISTAALLVSTDNPGSPNLQAGLAKLPVFTTVGGSAGLGQQFNRLDLSIKGDVERTVYQDSSVRPTARPPAMTTAITINMPATLRGGYELSPGVKPYVEIDADSRVHDLNTDFSGFQRDSKGLTGMVGSTFKLTQSADRRCRHRLRHAHL